MGYAVFKENKSGDYVFQLLYPGVPEASSGDEISGNVVALVKEERTPTTTYDVILSNNSKLAEIERIINESDITTVSITKNPS